MGILFNIMRRALYPIIIAIIFNQVNDLKNQVSKLEKQYVPSVDEATKQIMKEESMAKKFEEKELQKLRNDEKNAPSQDQINQKILKEEAIAKKYEEKELNKYEAIAKKEL